MLLPILRGKSPKKTALEKNIDFDTFFPLLSKLSEDEQIVVIFISDVVNNPVRDMDRDTKVQVISDYFKIPDTKVGKIFDECYTKDTKFYSACMEYKKYQKTPIESMYAALVHQCEDLSHQVKGLSVDFTKISDGQDKEFERLMKWQVEIGKLSKSIVELEEIMRSPEDIALFKGLVSKHKSVFDVKEKS